MLSNRQKTRMNALYYGSSAYMKLIHPCSCTLLRTCHQTLRLCISSRFHLCSLSFCHIHQCQVRVHSMHNKKTRMKKNYVDVDKNARLKRPLSRGVLESFYFNYTGKQIITKQCRFCTMSQVESG